jgi:hypothetical protein
MSGTGEGGATWNLHDGVHQRDNATDEHCQPGQQKHDPHSNKDGDYAVVVLCGGLGGSVRVTGAAASLQVPTGAGQGQQNK